MSSARPNGYSTLQISLHWAVVLLVLFQFLANGAMGDAWDAVREGAPVPPADVLGSNAHAGAGILVLLLAIGRIFLRLARGAPPPPENEATPLRILAHATHGLIYLLLFLVPLSGMAAWFGGVHAAIGVHLIGKTVLMWLIFLHIAGALMQHFVFRSPVLRRMMVPDNS